MGGLESGVITQIPGLSTHTHTHTHRHTHTKKIETRGETPKMVVEVVVVVVVEEGELERSVNTQIPGSTTKRKGQNTQCGGRGGGGGGRGVERGASAEGCKYRDPGVIHKT